MWRMVRATPPSSGLFAEIRACSPSARSERRCALLNQCPEGGPIRSEPDRRPEMRPAESRRTLIGGEPLGFGEHDEEHPQHRSRAALHRRTHGTRRRPLQHIRSEVIPRGLGVYHDRSRAPDAPRSPPRRWMRRSPSGLRTAPGRRRPPRTPPLPGCSWSRATRRPPVRFPAPGESTRDTLSLARSARSSSASRKSSRKGFRLLIRRSGPRVLAPPHGTGLRGRSAPAIPRRWSAAQ